MKPPLLILCATDLSADADLAVVAADDMARLFGSRLIFVHAVPYPAPAQVLFPHLVKGTTDRLMAVSRVASLTARAVEDIDVRVDVGAPDEVIVETAEESGADLLVIGVAGSDSEGSGLGATALRIARHAHTFRPPANATFSLARVASGRCTQPRWPVRRVRNSRLPGQSNSRFCRVSRSPRDRASRVCASRAWVGVVVMRIAVLPGWAIGP